ncbi:MAG: DUF3370 domain-containing protein [Candidatus Sericytochromatia bacterium]
MTKLRLASGVLAATLLVSGCAGWLRRGPDEAAATAAPSPTPVPQVATVTPLPILPLPGGLDSMLVFNSNSPEIVQTPGVLLSTRPQAPGKAYLNLPMTGTFQVFSHHIAKDEAPGARLLYLGLLAENRGAKPVTIALLRGVSYLSQPDALFKPLDPIIEDPEGAVYAGPGDRVSTDWIHGRSPLPPRTLTIPAGGSALLYSLKVPTDVAILPPINGRTTQIELRASGPVYMSEVARFAARTATGFVAPTPADYMATLNEGALAGPRDLAPTAFDPDGPAPGGRFVYGRVAGVSQGARWNAPLAAPEPGEAVGYPVATALLNRMGTQQVQSAPMIRRYPDTAYQGHGNYAVTYALTLPLENRGTTPRRFALTLSHPAKVEGRGADAKLTYMDPPNRAVTFRAPIRVGWRQKGGAEQVRFVHVVTRHGEAMAPFATIEVPPATAYEATVTLNYPADATPPQLLTIESR